MIEGCAYCTDPGICYDIGVCEHEASCDRCPACGAVLQMQTGRFQFACDRGHTLVTERPVRVVKRTFNDESRREGSDLSGG